jgi:hypothetical protein
MRIQPKNYVFDLLVKGALMNDNMHPRGIGFAMNNLSNYSSHTTLLYKLCIKTSKRITCFFSEYDSQIQHFCVPYILNISYNCLHLFFMGRLREQIVQLI